ncbi:MAG: hypothetical protein CVU29_06785 [Betaproteobacteria bacterium HGW-Betaproteobacteria-22]|nr:MAG: hypothetical protein CVU29_06785 [Betaproteobacteria bacterium HGW-Betaproteobacteria-22]
MLWLPGEVKAVSLLDGRLQVHGFVSQGMVNTTGNNFLGDSDDSISYDFREIAVNASYLARPELLFSAQVMSHRAGESDNGDPDIDYAFVDWTAFTGNWGRVGVRLGRVKNAFGLYNATRDVPFTRAGVILPQSIYFERTRKLSLSSDGVSFYADKSTNVGTFSAEATLGKPGLDKSSEAAIIPNTKGHFETDFTQLYQLKYESPTGQYVFALTHVNLGVSYRRAVNDTLQSGGFHFDPTLLSAQYNAENWSLTSEYARRPISLRGFGAIPNVGQVGESYYVQGTYRVMPDWEIMLRYDAAYSNRDDRHGTSFAKKTGRPGFTQYSKDWTLGLRYDVTPAFMLRAEYHAIEGTSILPPLDNTAGVSALEKRWDMFMLLGSYRF